MFSRLNISHSLEHLRSLSGEYSYPIYPCSQYIRMRGGTLYGRSEYADADSILIENVRIIIVRMILILVLVIDRDVV